MNRALIWATLASLSLACGSTTDDDNPQAGGRAGSGGSTAQAGAATGGRAGAGTAGRPAQAGESGEAGTDSAGGDASVVGGQGGGTGEAGGDGGGAAGAGGEAPCNEIELVLMQPTCGPFSTPPPPTAGVILDGVYALVSWQYGICLNLEQTLRISQTAPDTFDVESVDNFGNHANGVFVVDGTTLTATPTCGNQDPPDVFSYSAYDEAGVDYLHMADAAAQRVFTYERVGD